jgi:uncharacterized membrane protein (UPF0136 family)
MNRNGQSQATDYISYGYAFCVIAGGLAGYAKSGSVPSLAAGLLFGSLAAMGAYKSNVPIGLLTSGSLLGVMGYRFMNTGNLFSSFFFFCKLNFLF